MAMIACATPNKELLAALRRVGQAFPDLEPVEARAGLDLLRFVFDQRPRGVFLDLDAAESEGTELLRIFRVACDVPLVALTRSRDADFIAQALEVGADDVAEPTAPPVELGARMRAVLRRADGGALAPAEGYVVRTGVLEIDRLSREVRRRGSPVPLTRTEFRLLDALAERVGEMVPHAALLSATWGEEHRENTHYLRTYIGYLRAKLEDEPSRPRHLVSEWGVGYRLAQLPVESAGAASGTATRRGRSTRGERTGNGTSEERNARHASQ